MRWLVGSRARRQTIGTLYQNYCDVGGGRNGGNGNIQPNQAVETVKAVFDRFDADNSGLLDHEELPRLIGMLGCEDERRCRRVAAEMLRQTQPVGRTANGRGLKYDLVAQLSAEIEAFLVMQYLRRLGSDIDYARSESASGGSTNSDGRSTAAYNVWM